MEDNTKVCVNEFDANMCKHRICVPPNRDQVKFFVESNKTECFVQAGRSWPADGILSS
jgi:hypothetical protein